MSAKKYSEVIAEAVQKAIGCKAEPPDDMSNDCAHWFAMYMSQCLATDTFSKLAEARKPKALTARITELENQIERLNILRTQENSIRGNLTRLILRCCKVMRVYDINNEMAKVCMDYLRRTDLLGSPLRLTAELAEEINAPMSEDKS